MGLVFVALDYFRENDKAMTLLEDAFERVVVAKNRDDAFTELFAYRNECKALIIGVREKITKAFLDNHTALRVIGTLSVGVDHIDMDSAEKHHIDLVTTRGLNAHAVAEHALMFILCLLKDVFGAHALVVNGSDRHGLTRFPQELRGKKVGILGAGHSACALVNCLQPFECDVYLWTLHPERHKDLFEGSVKYCEIDEIFEKCHIVSLHLPLTRETATIVSTRRMMNLPHSAILINVARKELLKPENLHAVLQRRQDIRFGIDDFELSNQVYFDDLSKHGILSPHLAGATRESIGLMQMHIAEQVAHFAS